MANRTELHVLQDGYSKLGGIDETSGLLYANANCSCVLITGSNNIVIDTMTPWDTDFLIEALASKGLRTEDINYVVCTHGHSDHIGNNNLFLNAKHVVGYCVSFKDHYEIHPFEKGK